MRAETRKITSGSISGATFSFLQSNYQQGFKREKNAMFYAKRTTGKCIGNRTDVDVKWVYRTLT